MTKKKYEISKKLHEMRDMTFKATKLKSFYLEYELVKKSLIFGYFIILVIFLLFI